MKYNLVDATKNDGKKMLEVIESSPSKGVLQLLYTRRPNVYESYKKEDRNSILKVVKDDNNDIIFQVAAVNQKFYIEGEEKEIYYVGGLRKNEKYKQQIHWTDMFSELNKILPKHEFYCSILTDNKHAKDVLLKKRNGWPVFHEISNYYTNIFVPKAVLKNKWNNEKYEIQKLQKKNLKNIYNFLRTEGKKYNFFPVINDLENFADLYINNCYVLKNNNEILGFTALWNQENYKQFVVKKYGFPINILSKFNFITRKIGYIDFPKIDESFSFNYLSFFIVKNNNLDLYKILLYKICKELNGKIDSLVIGTTNDIFQNSIYNNIKKISFCSTIYYLYYGKKRIIKNEPYIECALL